MTRTIPRNTRTPRPTVARAPRGVCGDTTPQTRAGMVGGVVDPMYDTITGVVGGEKPHGDVRFDDSENQHWERFAQPHCTQPAQ